MAANGVRNQNGFLWNGVTPIYLAMTPLTGYLSQEGGLVQKLVGGLVSILPGGNAIARDRTIPGLAAFYVFVAFAASGAASVSGQAAARDEGLDNNSPRAHVNNLFGLPLRLRSAHLNLIENFPAWAVAAAIAQATCPGNQAVINVLGLHVILKTLVFYPAYLLDVAPLRSLSHLLATGSVLNALWQVTKGAR